MTVERSERSGLGRDTIAVVAPLAIIALAYALWWISDRLLYIGPLDRAAFGWAVVIPVWIAAPIVGGFAWARVSGSAARRTALVVGGLIGMIAAGLFWQSVATPACEFGAIRTPSEWIPGAALLGAVVGSGIGVSGLVAAAYVRRNQRWRAVLLGAVTELTMVFLAIAVAGTVLLGAGCQRPPV